MLCDSEVSELDSPCHSWLWETLPDTAPCLATQQGHLLPLAWAPFIVTEVEEAEDTEGSSGAPRATPGSRALPPTASARQSWGASGADPGLLLLSLLGTSLPQAAAPGSGTGTHMLTLKRSTYQTTTRMTEPTY